MSVKKPRSRTGWAGIIKQHAQPTEQQKPKGRRITSPVLLPLTAGDGI